MTSATDADEGIGPPNAARWPSSAATWPIWPERIAIVITSGAHLPAAGDIDPHTAALGHRELQTPARDTVWREDDQQPHLFDGPWAMATFGDVTHITDTWRHARPKPLTLRPP